jgi:hypothetical protein
MLLIRTHKQLNTESTPLSCASEFERIWLAFGAFVPRDCLTHRSGHRCHKRHAAPIHPPPFFRSDVLRVAPSSDRATQSQALDLAPLAERLRCRGNRTSRQVRRSGQLRKSGTQRVRLLQWNGQTLLRRKFIMGQAHRTCTTRVSAVASFDYLQARQLGTFQSRAMYQKCIKPSDTRPIPAESPQGRSKTYPQVKGTFRTRAEPHAYPEIPPSDQTVGSSSLSERAE